MNAPDTPAQVSPEVQALALAELERRVRASRAAVKAIVGQSYADGERRTIRSPLDGAKLGTVHRSDPDAEWKVTDREALDAHLRTYEGAVETVLDIAPADMSEALAVLQDHAPHLLTVSSRVRPGVVDAAVAESRDRGEPVAPGIERVKPAGVLTVRPDKACGEAVAALVTAGLLTWDGRPAALPAGESGAA